MSIDGGNLRICIVSHGTIDDLACFIYNPISVLDYQFTHVIPNGFKFTLNEQHIVEFKYNTQLRSLTYCVDHTNEELYTVDCFPCIAHPNVQAEIKKQVTENLRKGMYRNPGAIYDLLVEWVSTCSDSKYQARIGILRLFYPLRVYGGHPSTALLQNECLPKLPTTEYPYPSMEVMTSAFTKSPNSWYTVEEIWAIMSKVDHTLTKLAIQASGSIFDVDAPSIQYIPLDAIQRVVDNLDVYVYSNGVRLYRIQEFIEFVASVETQARLWMKEFFDNNFIPEWTENHHRARKFVVHAYHDYMLVYLPLSTRPGEEDPKLQNVPTFVRLVTRLPETELFREFWNSTQETDKMDAALGLIRLFNVT